MNYKISDQAIELNAKLEVFMEQYIYPHEKDYDEFTSNQDNLWQYPDWYEGLKNEAKKQDLWNLFLPKEYTPWSPGLTNVEIALLFENNPALILPRETIIAPVNVARSIINLGLYFFSVQDSMSANTSLPSASVFKTSIV